MTHQPWYDGYWVQWTVQNILPNPAWWLLVVAPALVWRKRLKAWWHRHFGPDLDGVREDAAAARRMAGDLWHQLTGEEHPHAPGKDEPR